MTPNEIESAVMRVFQREVFPLFERLIEAQDDLSARMGRVEAEIFQMKAEMNEMKAEMNEMKAEMNEMRQQELAHHEWVVSKIDRIETEILVISSQMRQYDSAFGAGLQSETANKTELIVRVSILERELSKVKKELSMA